MDSIEGSARVCNAFPSGWKAFGSRSLFPWFYYSSCDYRWDVFLLINSRMLFRKSFFLFDRLGLPFIVKTSFEKERGYICWIEKKSLILHSDNRKNNNIKYQGNEKNIPTFKQKESQQAWLSLENVYRQRSSRACQPSRQRPQGSHRIG